MEPLNPSSSRPTGGGGGDDRSGMVETVVHTQGGTLDRLEVPSADASLPSADAVWSPILALRSFVEPLTVAASAAFRNLHISFYDQGPAQQDSGGSSVTALALVGSTAGEGREEDPAEPHQSCTAVVVPAEEARSTVGIEPCAGVEVVEFGHDRDAEAKSEEERKTADVRREGGEVQVEV